MSIVIAIIVFSAIVLFHEFGHFLLAKANGIVVTEFSLGFGPRLWSKEKNGTRYSLKAFPLGGSCIMLGEDQDVDLPGSFHGAPVFGRILVVAAGPVFNFLLAFLLSIVIVGYAGVDLPFVRSVNEGSEAEKAGLQEGDLIVGYNGYKVDVSRDLYVYTYINGLKEDREIRMTVKRDGKKIDLSYYPDVNVRYLLGFNRSDSNSLVVDSLIEGYPLEEAGLQEQDVIVAIDGVEFPDGAAFNKYLEEHPLGEKEIQVTFERDGLRYDVGIVPAVYRTPTAGFSYNTAYEKVSALAVPGYASGELKYMLRSTLLSLRSLIGGRLSVNELSGPVGVVDAIGTTYTESRKMGIGAVLINLFALAALLSANLGIMNLLPLPALDGGRLVFLIIEAVRRKPVNREIEGSIHFTGLVLLMILMAFIMYSDILKLIR